MKIKVLTLFPEMFAPMDASIIGRARREGLLELECLNIRDYTADKHRRVDDYPFGGGAGMIMACQPICDAMRAAEAGYSAPVRRVYMSPRGKPFTQRDAERLAAEPGLIILCGHYEGVDQRALDMCVDEELSIGDYVLTGGELAAMVVIDAVARLVPGVLGSGESAQDESFSDGLLEYPQYTRPAVYQGVPVPEVLLSGHAANIAAWRRERAMEVTRARRPDMWTPELTAEVEAREAALAKKHARAQQRAQKRARALAEKAAEAAAEGQGASDVERADG